MGSYCCWRRSEVKEEGERRLSHSGNRPSRLTCGIRRCCQALNALPALLPVILSMTRDRWGSILWEKEM